VTSGDMVKCLSNVQQETFRWPSPLKVSVVILLLVILLLMMFLSPGMLVHYHVCSLIILILKNLFCSIFTNKFFLLLLDFMVFMLCPYKFIIIYWSILRRMYVWNRQLEWWFQWNVRMDTKQIWWFRLGHWFS